MTTHCKENDVKVSNKLVFGIGFNCRTFSTVSNGKQHREYSLWQSMLERCTEKLWVKFSTYRGTTCSENFKSYAYFYDWCKEQVGFYNKDEKGRSWCLDKDILIKGNKHYSEDTCVFIPHRINCLLTKCDSLRGDFPIGVCWCKDVKKFLSQCNNSSGRQRKLGRFNTPQEAFQAYKTYKEALIKEVANEYKEQLDYRVYEALMNYEVNEND